MTSSTLQVLITGCYRSGTEYITQLLNNQPQLAARMYVTNFMRFCYGRYDPICAEANYTRLLFDAAHRIRLRWGRNLDIYRILDDCRTTDDVTYAFLYEQMVIDLFPVDRGGRWAEKTQLVWTKIPDFLRMFPQGKALHVVRDPRCVLASFKAFTHAPEPAYLGAVFNCLGSMQSGVKYREQFGPDSYCLIRFEDVLLRPEDTLRDVFAFLGLSADHDLLSQEGWVDAAGHAWQHNSAFLPREADGHAFDAGAALERWKALEDWEIVLCEAVNEPIFESYRYALSGLSVDWGVILKHLLGDEKLIRYLAQWVLHGGGVEEFPTDPIEEWVVRNCTTW